MTENETPKMATMTLRDFFAAQAMLVLANDRRYRAVDDADVCYEIADAMLKAREAK
ncbi:MAG: hypothetical protein ORN28_06785 [Rhodoferax sp.]|nr:hypothetical protein [Rhodoferax sp.]